MPERLAEVERLLAQVDALPPAEQEIPLAVAGALLDLYGEGLGRIVEVVSAGDHDGTLADAFAEDETIAEVLLLHGLHPVPIDARVQQALDSVTPYLRSHGGSVELLEVHGGVVKLRLQGSCSGCPSSAMTLKLAIEEAIHRAAPEIEEVRAEGEQPATPASGGLLQIQNAMPAAPPGPCPAAELPLHPSGTGA